MSSQWQIVRRKSGENVRIMVPDQRIPNDQQPMQETFNSVHHTIAFRKPHRMDITLRYDHGPSVISLQGRCSTIELVENIKLNELQVIKWVPQDETYRQYRIPEERLSNSILAKSSTFEHMEYPNVKKFPRECRIIQQLKHSNIVTFIRTITDEKRMKIGIVHRVQIVHRDINPNNLLRTTEEQIKITDFGLSEEYAEDRPLRGTIGTPQYLAPECVKEPGEPYDGKPVDVWALGMTLYWMIQRENYYDGENKYDIFEKIQTEPAVVERQDGYVIFTITYAAR
ncbi:hypothetical protein CRM22_000874 [Opisthorchis felineus]|uniref:Protein kinase domain-containing protein n=1 Tax=Opisthorchis felineus TaxID=147828 RepID=A0A4S2MD21_OPIFE|nr:hypothetical protein CRM22_000874 [Opisthorchis felineus]